MKSTRLPLATTVVLGTLVAAADPALAQSGVPGPREIFSVTMRAESEVLAPRRATTGWSMQGDQIAWGEGTVSGDLRGDIDFSLLAKKPRRDDPMDVFFVGWLFLPEGEEVLYEAEGWAVQSESDPSQWFVTARMRFRETEGPYGWLATARAAWIGSFDAASGEGSFRVLTADRP